MQDSELKKLLLETYPVLPGQEARAWMALRTKLNQPARSASSWFYLPSLRGTGAAFAALLLIAAIGGFFNVRSSPLSFLSADSQSPGIYATAFYSKSAGAQVVWLNGLEPATDRPTYLDPTTNAVEKADSKSEDPTSL